VLTNRHVVRDNEFGMVEGLKILDPADATHKRELPATVVAISADHDLALVRCEAIKSPAIPFNLSAPKRGMEILVLGYPKSNFIGQGHNATQGTIAALPEDENDGMLLLDAEINGGNSGGPILDKTGAAIGIVTPKYNSAIVENYSTGIPSTTAATFTKTLLPDLAGESGAEKEWPDVDSRAAPSTVMLLCYYRTVSIGFNKASPTGASKGSRNNFEDTSCSLCNGTGKRPCPQAKKGCVKGEITRLEPSTKMAGAGVSKRTVNTMQPVKYQCNACDGHGYVDCGACSKGRDTSVGGRR
jgi:hypothetical protein